MTALKPCPICKGKVEIEDNVISCVRCRCLFRIPCILVTVSGWNSHLARWEGER